MYFYDKNIHVIIVDNLDVSQHFWCNDAILFEVVNGKGAFKWNTQHIDDSSYGDRYLSELLLNDKPILQVNQPGCPTCAGLLAVGYGIENLKCAELNAIADKANEPYKDLEQAFTTILPLLGLLKNGLYVLADCTVFPSDGEGHFFWNVPNEFTENATTAELVTKVDDGYDCISGIPAFLYPSQGTDSFNPDRAEYYKNLLYDRSEYDEDKDAMKHKKKHLPASNSLFLQ